MLTKSATVKTLFCALYSKTRNAQVRSLQFSVDLQVDVSEGRKAAKGKLKVCGINGDLFTAVSMKRSLIADLLQVEWIEIEASIVQIWTDTVESDINIDIPLPMTLDCGVNCEE